MIKNLLSLAILAAGVAAAPVVAATTTLTFDGATDPNPQPACSASNGDGPAAVICVAETSKLGNDYGSTAELTVRYARTVNTANGTAVSPNLLFLYANGNGVGSSFGDINNTARIFFTPTAGYEVSFDSFDFINRNARGNANFKLLDGAGNSIFDFTSFSERTRTTYSANTAFFGGRLTLVADGIGSSIPSLDNIRLTTRLIAAPGAVPEPATWTMMIIGFGAVGAASRRRRSIVLA